MIVFCEFILCLNGEIRPRIDDSVANWGANGVTKRENKLLNRKKRYLTFPKGASFIVSKSIFLFLTRVIFLINFMLLCINFALLHFPEVDFNG